MLAPNGAEPVEVKLVEALCAEHQTNPIKVDDNRKLGEWSASAKVMERENKVAVCDG